MELNLEKQPVQMQSWSQAVPCNSHIVLLQLFTLQIKVYHLLQLLNCSDTKHSSTVYILT